MTIDHLLTRVSNEELKIYTWIARFSPLILKLVGILPKHRFSINTDFKNSVSVIKAKMNNDQNGYILLQSQGKNYLAKGHSR